MRLRKWLKITRISLNKPNKRWLLSQGFHLQQRNEPETEMIDTSSKKKGTTDNPIVEEIEELGFSSSHA